jgi:ferric-dicitrate binding protein FerR (iron transport regulator)
MKAEELPLLVEGYLAGGLSEATRSSLATTLAADTALRHDFVAQLRSAQALEAGMREHDAAAVLERVHYLLERNRESQQLRTIRAVERRLPRRRGPPRWIVPVAAAVAAALVIGLMLQHGSVRSGPSVMIASGAPHLLRDGADLALNEETPLRAGDRIRCDAQAAATLRWPGEDTTIALEAGADLTVVASAAGKRVLLDAGRVEATVAKQPPGHPLVIATPRADAKVVGTRFGLAVAGGASFLQVDEGTVALLHGGDTLSEVRAGSGAVVDATGARTIGVAGELFAGGAAAWNATRGSWRLEDGVAILQNPAGQSTRIESLATWRDFELTCDLRATGGRTYTEIQVFDVPHAVTVHHTIDDPGWKAVRLIVRGGRIEGTCDGSPLACETSQPLPAAGTIAFFVSGDRRLEVAHARIRDLPRE